jgi:hypothetical protein
MNFRDRLFFASAGLAALGLAGCAGTPPAGSTAKVASSKRCERSLGSLLCNGDGDAPQGSMNDPSLIQPQLNVGGNGGH